MSYTTTITKKGQITIPKKLRDALHLQEGKRLVVELGSNKKQITITEAPDILELAGTFKIKGKIDSVKAREFMEKHYERA